MRNRLVRVTSLLFAFILCVSNCSFCYAADSPSYTTDSNLWHWLNNTPVVQGFTLGLLPYIKSTDVCGESDDGKHHASSVTGISDSGYYICVCEDCGNEFTSSTRAEETYADYTATLPASSVTSDGGILWAPTMSDITNITMRWDNNVNLVDRTDYMWYNDYSQLQIIDNYGTVRFRFNYPSVQRNKDFRYECLSLRVPYTGTYSNKYTFHVYGAFSDRSVDLYETYSETYNTYNLEANHEYTFYGGTDKDFFHRYRYGTTFTCQSGTIYMSGPLFEIIPFSGSYDVSTSDTSATYNTGTRAASITGNYGIITESGDVQKIESQTIVNEGAKTYYNPTTNETTSFTDWTYDYSDRSYTLTTTEGDTTTITYGDEYVTIHEGDTITNVYYITEVSDNSGGGSETPSAPHSHNYTSTITTAATCILPGVRTYTCSGCDSTYTESIPATGHSWMVKQQVPTEYDENGDLLTEGYTIYRCSVCGEEYKTGSSGSMSLTLGERCGIL